MNQKSQIGILRIYNPRIKRKPRNGRNPIDPKRPDINIPKNTPSSVNIKPQKPDTFQKRSITEE